MLQYATAIVALLLLSSTVIANEDVACVQKVLSEQGYQVGSADGALGPRTEAAGKLIAEHFGLGLPALAAENAAEWCVRLSELAPLPGVEFKPGILNRKDIAVGFPELQRDREYRRVGWSYRIVTDVVRGGDEALRVEIRDGDCGAAGGWDDCAVGAERSELLAQCTYREGQHFEYGWSMFIDSSWPASSWPGHDAIIGQLQQNSAVPAFQFIWEGDGMFIKPRVKAGFENGGHDIATIIPEDEFRGRWHDLKIDVKWTRKEGNITVFRNGALVYDYRGPTLSADQACFKIGIYRDGGWSPTQTMVAWFDDIYAKKL